MVEGSNPTPTDAAEYFERQDAWALAEIDSRGPITDVDLDRWWKSYRWGDQLPRRLIVTLRRERAVNAELRGQLKATLNVLESTGGKMSNTKTNTDLTKVQNQVEDALRAAWAAYATSGDWYDAAGPRGMAAVVMDAIQPLVDEVADLRREIAGPLSTDEVARRGWRF